MNNKYTFVKIAAWTFASIIFLGLVALSILPSAVSTSWGKSQFLNIVNSQIPGNFQMQAINASWFGNQALQGIKLKDPSGNTVVTINKVFTSASLFDILFGRINEGDIEIAGLDLTLIEEKSGFTNLHKALGERYLPHPFYTVPATSSPNPLTIILSDVNAKGHFNLLDESMSLLMKGRTKQGDIIGQFEVDASLVGDHLKTMHPSGVSIKIRNFPVALIDHIMTIKEPQLAGISHAALGDTLDVAVQQEFSPDGVHFVIGAKSPTLNASLSGEVKAGVLTLNQPGLATLTLMPEFVTRLKKVKGDILPVSLLSPVQADIVINHLSIPLTFFSNPPIGGNVDPVLSASLSIGETDLKGAAFDEPIILKKLEAALKAPEKSQVFNLQIQGEAIQDGNPIQIKLDATVDKPQNIQNIIQSIKKRTEMQMKVKGAPTAFLDHVLGLSPTLVNLFGAQAAVNILTTSTNGQAQVQLAMDSEKLSVPGMKWNVGNQLTLAQETSIRYRIDPSLIAKYLDVDQLPASLQKDVWLDVKLNKMVLPTSLANRDGFIDVEISASPAVPLNIHLAALIKDNYFLQLTSPIEASYTIMPENLKALDSPLALVEPAKLHLEVDPFPSPIDIRDFITSHFANLQLSGQVYLDSLTLATQRQVTIQNLAFPWIINGHAKRIDIGLKGSTQIANLKGILNGQVIITQWLDSIGNLSFESAKAITKIKLEKLPTEFIQAFSDQPLLVSLIGPSIDLMLNGNFELGPPITGAMDIGLQANLLEGNLALMLDGNKISLQNPSNPITVNATLTPERFHSLRMMLNSQVAHELLTLLEPARLTARIQDLSVPLNMDPESSATVLKGQLNIDKLHISENVHNKIALEQIALNIETHDIAKEISFQLNANETSDADAISPLVISGKMDNFLTDSGQINKQDLSVKLEAKSNALPVSLLCKAVGIEEDARHKIEALLGKTIKTDVDLELKQMNGPIHAKFQGSNGNVSLDGQLTNGVLTLHKPFTVEVTVTPQLGKSILEDVLPILAGVISSEQPLKITVSPEDFSLPIGDIEPDNIQIGMAKIELGKMTFKNDSQIGNIFALLRPSHNVPLTVWFTPLYLQMKDGKVSLQRMDMLVMDLYPLALWGKINLIKDKVDMRIGLTATALEHALNIQGLESDYMMQLPFTGTLGNAAIDKGRATGRISSLVAQSMGNTQGLLIGTVLGIASGNLMEEKPPAPTTNPLPWDTLTSSSGQSTKSKDHAEKKQSHRKSRKDAKKNLGEEASNLLNNLLN